MYVLLVFDMVGSIVSCNLAVLLNWARRPHEAGQLRPELVVPTIRYLLERGRVFNSSGYPAEAQIWFQQAWELARVHEQATFLQ